VPLPQEKIAISTMTMHSTMTIVVIHGLRLEGRSGVVGLLSAGAPVSGCDDARGGVTAAADAEPAAGVARTWAAAVIGTIALDSDTGRGSDTRRGGALGAAGEAEPGVAEPGEREPREVKPDNNEPRELKSGDDEPRESEPGDDEPREGEPGDDVPGEGEPGDDVPGEDRSGDGSVAMPSATLLRAAMMTMGS
jgi:hypothetical protein